MLPGTAYNLLFAHETVPYVLLFADWLRPVVWAGFLKESARVQLAAYK